MTLSVQFYHLLSTPLERALPKLLEKAYHSGQRAVVRCGSDAQCEMLNKMLWTYDPARFLPHGSAKDGHSEDQPIFLTAAAENPNRASLLFVTDGSQPEALEGVTKLFDLFDGQDEAALAAARARWKSYQAAGHALAYFRQTPQGGWENMTTAAA